MEFFLRALSLGAANLWSLLEELEDIGLLRCLMVVVGLLWSSKEDVVILWRKYIS